MAIAVTHKHSSTDVERACQIDDERLLDLMIKMVNAKRASTNGGCTLTTTSETGAPEASDLTAPVDVMITLPNGKKALLIPGDARLRDDLSTKFGYIILKAADAASVASCVYAERTDAAESLVVETLQHPNISSADLHRTQGDSVLRLKRTLNRENECVTYQSATRHVKQLQKSIRSITPGPRGQVGGRRDAQTSSLLELDLEELSRVGVWVN
ncbi:hypothetical protein C8R46DRAFT_1031334 [Mycena filopes]|nr:hypothetical protein C8R46DRAFT_1031334 [Mycena filopes]